METNIDLQVINDRNEDTFVVIETQLSNDSEETQSDSNSFKLHSIENHKRDVNRIRKKYYVWIRCLFAILISVGYPLHNWLISGDRLRDSYHKYGKLWWVNQMFYCLCALLVLSSISFTFEIDVIYRIFVGFLNITSICCLFAYFLCEDPNDILTKCFNTSDTESHMENRDILEANLRTNLVLNIVSNFCLFTVPILVVVLSAIIPLYGLTPIIVTLTAVNLTTMTINFVIYTIFCSVLKQLLESLDSHFEEHVLKLKRLGTTVSVEILNQFHKR